MLIRQRECHSYYRDVHYYAIICPAHCLLIGYDTSRRDEKMNMFIFRRSRIEGRIEVESQSNRNCRPNRRLTGLLGHQPSIQEAYLAPRACPL